MKADNGSELARRVAAVAGRLRLVQAELADEPEAVRHAHLRDELDRAVAGLGPDDRASFMEALAERFPVWASVGEAPVPPSAAPDPAAQAALAAMNDPEALASRLVDLAASLPEEQRRAVVERLAPLMPPAPEPAPRVEPGSADAAMRRFAKMLDVGDGARLDPARLAEVAEVLVKFAGSLDQWVWNTWQQRLAPRSAVRRREALLRTIAQYGSGEAGASMAQVTGDVERLRQIVLALISAVNQSGTLFAQRWLERFAVGAIEQAAEPATVWEGKPVKCWKKYVELAAPLDRAAIEKDIVEAVTDYVETLMKSR